MQHSSSDSENPYASPAITDDDAHGLPLDAPLARPIRISGRLSLEDYIAGAKLAGQAHFFSGCLSSVLLLFLVGFIMNGAFHQMKLVAFASAFIYLAFFIVAKSLEICDRRRLKKLFEAEEGVFELRTILASEETVDISTETSYSKSLWSLYGNFKNSKDVLVLVSRDDLALFDVIPRAHFTTDDDWKLFQSLLKRKMKQNQTADTSPGGLDVAKQKARQHLPAPPTHVENSRLDGSPDRSAIFPIVISGQLAPKDYSLASKMLMHSIRPFRRHLGLPTTVIFLSTLIVDWWCWLHYSYQEELPLAHSIFAGSIAIVLLSFLALVWKTKRKNKKALQRNQAGFSHFTAHIHEQGVLYFPEEAYLDISWNSFHKYEANESLAILFHKGDQLVRIFARHTFSSDADWTRFIELLERIFPGSRRLN